MQAESIFPLHHPLHYPHRLQDRPANAYSKLRTSATGFSPPANRWDCRKCSWPPELGITQSTYAGWERRTTALKPEYISKLADALNVSVDHLLDHENAGQRKGGEPRRQGPPHL